MYKIGSNNSFDLIKLPKKLNKSTDVTDIVHFVKILDAFGINRSNKRKTRMIIDKFFDEDLKNEIILRTNFTKTRRTPDDLYKQLMTICQKNSRIIIYNIQKVGYELSPISNGYLDINRNELENLNKKLIFTTFEIEDGLTFPKLTVLTGKNGSSKTSFLKKLFLCRHDMICILRGSLEKIPHGHEITQINYFDENEREEVQRYQDWLYNGEKDGFPKNFIHQKINKLKFLKKTNHLILMHAFGKNKI